MSHFKESEPLSVKDLRSKKPYITENGQTLGEVAAVVGIVVVAPICLAAALTFNPWGERQNSSNKIHSDITPVLREITPVSPSR